MRSRRAAMALLLLTAACGAPETVQSWITTGDRAILLSAQPAIALSPTSHLPDSAGIVSIAIDTAQRLQPVHGFGAALTDASAWLLTHRLSTAQRSTLLRELFGRDSGGIGLSVLRITLGASDFSRTHYSYDDVAPGTRDDSLRHFSIAPAMGEVVPVLREALAINPALRIMGTPWSAPAWMKTSGSLLKGTLRTDAHDAYARYLVRTVDAFAEAGVPIALLSVQNEPHHEPNDYPGMRLDAAQRAQLIGRHLGPRLVSRNPAIRLLDWDHNWEAPESPLAVLGDTLVRRFVHGVAWHCYAGDVSAQGQVHDAYPDKETWFTECAGGDWAPDFGDNLRWNSATLVIGTVRQWARGVMLWNLALDEHHGPHLGGCNDCRGVVTIDSATGAVTRNEEYYALAHASRYVRPGAVRLASPPGIDSVESVALRNDDGELVLIAVNLARAPRTLRVHSGERGFAATLPAGAVATYVWR